VQLGLPGEIFSTTQAESVALGDALVCVSGRLLRKETTLDGEQAAFKEAKLELFSKEHPLV
jgi:hypothetical protein